MKQFSVRIDNGFEKNYRGSSAALAVKRALKAASIKVGSSVLIEVVRLPDVRYEYYIAADVKSLSGATVRTVLGLYGGYKTKRSCQRAIEGLRSSAPVVQGHWQFLAPRKSEIVP